MELTLKGLSEAGLELNYEQDPAGLDLPEDLLCEGPIRVWLRAERHGETVTLRGMVSGRLRVTCARCLAAFPSPIRSTFDLVLRPEPTGWPGEAEVAVGDLDLLYYRGEIVPIDDRIREQVILSVPIASLCRPDCRGLCRTCGADLNRAVCPHPTGGVRYGESEA